VIARQNALAAGPSSSLIVKYLKVEVLYSKMYKNWYIYLRKLCFFGGNETYWCHTMGSSCVSHLTSTEGQGVHEPNLYIIGQSRNVSVFIIWRWVIVYGWFTDQQRTLQSFQPCRDILWNCHSWNEFYYTVVITRLENPLKCLCLSVSRYAPLTYTLW
jgi:hypothetical protein